MNVIEFQSLKDLNNLIPCRKVAYDNAEEMKVSLYGEKFNDLLAFYKGQWHYISTIKN